MDVLYKKTPFKLAIENTCSRHTVFRDDRKKLTNVVGCSLRHFYIFEQLISQTGKEFNNEQFAALLLFLSNELFVPVFSSEEIEKQFVKLQIDKAVCDKLIELSKDKTKLIPEQYSNESIEYLHYRFNIPMWTLKMWMKHYKGYTYKIVRTINKPANHYAILNKSLLSKDDLLANYSEIKLTATDGLYLYDGNVAPKRHSLYKEGKLVGISPAEYYLLSKLDLDVLRKIAIYSETYNNLHLQLMALLSNRYSADLVAGRPEAYYSVKKDIETYGLNNLKLYETGHSSIVTCISSKVHTFFVCPQNSNFAEFRKSPDYFNRVNQEELDAFISNQTASLISASEFVEDGGNLIYMVPTMDKKETIQIIDNFLNQKEDYSLVEQKQFLPFDKYDSSLFIAVFRKEGSND